MSCHEPTVEEELHRKSGEALLWLDNMLKRGAIAGEAAIVALTLMDLATLGLIPREYSEWVGEKRREIRSEKYPDKVVLEYPSIIVVLELRRDLGEVHGTQIRPIGHKKKVYTFEETDQVAAAVAAYPGMIEKLISSGYKVIA